MIIRCPNCEYSRTINISNIPSSAEMATCPKCKHRFRFRTLETAVEAEPSETLAAPSPAVPQGRTSPDMDIWDAMDALQLRWEKNLEEQVADISVKNDPPPDEGPATPGVPKRLNGGETEASLPDRESHEEDQDETPPETEAETPPPAPEPEQPSLEKNLVESESSFTAPVINNYEDLPPEERVERDLGLLKGEGDRPTRDLGMLKEFDSSAEQPADKSAGQKVILPQEKTPTSTKGVVPWENPGSFGWIRAFYLTVHEAMLDSPSFFARLRPEGSLGPGYLFFLILGYLAVLGSVLWTEIAVYLLPTLNEPLSPSGNILSIIFLAPFALGLLQLAVAGSIRAMQKLFTSSQSDFPLVFKVVSYSIAPMILSVIPFVGPVVGAVWFLVTLLAGSRYALGLSLPLSIAVTFLPALILIYSVFWYFL